LLAQVYAELRQLARAKMASEQPGHTLQPTALVHEAWIRLGDQSFENRAHFFSAAAEAMRRILIDSALRKPTEKHGAKAELVKLRYFVGLTIEEAADVLNISAPTAKRDWTYAKAWLYRAIQQG
jgi:DNA-directed RNA polymerase specialized sigma24 family protein